MHAEAFRNGGETILPAGYGSAELCYKLEKYRTEVRSCLIDLA